jgi:phage terminase large subunit GpA-like protein
MQTRLNDLAFLKTLTEQKPIDRGPKTVSEHVHNLRIMPPGNPLPGIVDIYRTPYLIEIMDNMSPSSPVQEQDIMKSVQSAMTFGAENVIITAAPRWNMEVLYVTGTDELLKKWGKRLEPCIDSCGLRGNIVSQITDKKTRTTGDKQLSKRFRGGGGLTMGSAQSPASLRADSIQMLVIDEVDSAPEMLRTGEGNYVDVASGRTEAFLWKKKIMRFSTPTTWEASLIFKLFKLGDQREYYVPCKRCKKHFYMQFEMLVPEYKAGYLELAWLKCPHCDEPHFNHDKTEMLKIGNAFWHPESKPMYKDRRSYHISKLMVPVGLATWTNVYNAYIKAQSTPGGMRTFYNLQLGLPYKETGSRPKWETIDDFRGGYNGGEIQDDVLFLTVGMDVQRGSKTNSDNPPRLEMEVLGHGKNFRTWGIEYKMFVDPEGPDGPGVTDPSSGAWQVFIDWAIDNLKYKRKDGRLFLPEMIFIDSGDGVTMDTVYQFTQRPDVPPIVFPVKGLGFFKKNKATLGDEVTQHNMLRYKAQKNVRSGDVVFYDIATNHYKKHIYRNLKVQRTAEPGKPQKMGFCDFPIGGGYDGHYFKMLTSEEMYADGSFHKGSYTNEALDCRVYALCAADVYLDMLVYSERERLKKLGMAPHQIQIINRLWILDRLEAEVTKKGAPKKKPLSRRKQ